MTSNTQTSLSVDDMLMGEILMSLKRGNRPDHVTVVAPQAATYRHKMTNLSVKVSLPSVSSFSSGSHNPVDNFNFDTFSALSPMTDKLLPPFQPMMTMTPRSVSKRYGPVVQLEDLRGCFNLPIAAVAHKFGICVTLLKKICRRHGIQRWPHRQIRSLQKSIDILRESLYSAKGTNKEYVAKKIMAFEYTLECIIQDPNAAAKGILAGRLASPATEEMIKRGNRAKSRKLKTQAAMSDDEVENVSDPTGVSSVETMPIQQDWMPKSGSRRLNTRRASLPMSLQSILC
ncbi:unnamed protein product [Peronospora destructor]|uniref:RWP-RK domain-containing protein n=1 Tax=Peronospora destructor TaxID=86335 RepID=A0AAV0VAM4_9STRA|nr:unnamed protein product [Peronospora destructor]